MSLTRFRTTLRASLALLACLAAATATAATVDLDAPGARDALRAAAPRRADRVDAILADAARLPALRAAQVLQARYDLDTVDVGLLLLVSYPAQRRVSFAFDGTDYRATVTMVDMAAPRPAHLARPTGADAVGDDAASAASPRRHALP